MHINKRLHGQICDRWETKINNKNGLKFLLAMDVQGVWIVVSEGDLMFSMLDIIQSKREIQQTVNTVKWL